jgi:amino acid transporter
MQVAEPREGYELWRPNREKSESKATKALVALVLLISAALLLVITLGGWERLQGFDVGVVTIIWAALYVLFAFLVAARWNRGVLPLASALAVIMIIFAAVAAGGWFSRDKEGLDSPVLPEELLGLLTLVVIPVQLLLIVVAMVGFNQQWHVEEERPVGGGFHPGDEESPREREERRELEGAT